MFIADLLLAFVIALLLSLLFVPSTRRERAGDGGAIGGIILFYFLILFLATWAGGLWLAPFGPVYSGVYWVPFVLFGLFVALLLAAAASASRHRYPERDVTTTATTERDVTAATAFGVLFWVLIIALLAAVIVAYSV